MQHVKDSLSKSFAEALVKARGERSQAEFARALGIANQQTYQRYENGLVPSGLVLYNIATRLGVSVDALLTGGKLPAGAAAVAHENCVLWATEMLDATQFNTAVTAFAEVMTSKQLVVAVDKILKKARLSDEAKVFWSRLLMEWMLVKSEVEEKAPDIAERTTGQPVTPATSINYTLQSSVDKLQELEDCAGVRLTWKELKTRLKKVTEPRGKRSELAQFLGVNQSSINSWLDDDREPGASATLALVDWVAAEEGKSTRPAGAQTPADQMTQTERRQDNETKQSEPGKPSPGHKKKSTPRSHTKG